MLVGQRDILKHEGFASIIATNIEDARMKVLPRAGHAAVIEQPDTVAREIDAFISGVES